MALRIVLFDMLEISRLPDTLDIPIQILQIIVEERVIVPNDAEIAFEMLDIDRVELDHCCVKPDIDFCQLRTQDIRLAALGEELLELVERGKNRNDVVVGLLVRAKPAL